MRTRLLECDACESSFCVEHEMDDKFYSVEWCPFCGASLEIEESIDEDWLDPDETVES